MATNFTAQDLMVTGDTTKGQRLHRPTCKKLPASAQPLDQAHLAPEARAASCCKPSTDMVAEAIADQPVADRLVEGTYSGSAILSQIVKQGQSDGYYSGYSAEEPEAQSHIAEADEELVTDTVRFADSTAPGYMWKTIGSGMAEELATGFPGVEVSVLNSTKALELTGTSADVVEARMTIAAIWDLAFAAVKDHKRSDEYRALPPKGEKWYTSERWASEQEFMVAYIRTDIANLAADLI